jgi:serpin B
VDEGFTPKYLKISFDTKNVSNFAALNVMLREYDLAWTIRNESVCVTTKAASETNLTTRIYDVYDLAVIADEYGDIVYDFDSITELITSAIAPQQWLDVGGPGTVHGVENSASLVISCTVQLQLEVEHLLNNLRAARIARGTRHAAKGDMTIRRDAVHDAGNQPEVESGAEEHEGKSDEGVEQAAPNDGGVEHEATVDRRRREIVQRLERPSKLKIDGRPLVDLPAILKTELGVPVYLDRRELAEAGVVADGLTVSFDADGLSNLAAINLILGEHGLSWTIRDESLCITTKEASDQNLTVRTFMLYDLSSNSADKDLAAYDSDAITDLIQTVVERETWSRVGGFATIEVLEGENSAIAVVNHTIQAQSEIENLLRKLRAARNDAAHHLPLRTMKRTITGPFGERRAVRIHAPFDDANGKAVVDSVARFACDVYGGLRKRQGNLVLSPYSVASAMAMTYSGARGDTAAQIAKAMRFADEDATLGGLGVVESYLQSDPSDFNSVWQSRNNVWLNGKLSVRDEWLVLAKNQGWLTGRFSDNKPRDAEKMINAVIAKQSGRLIEEFLPPNSINANTGMVLANVVYFHKPWAMPFDLEPGKATFHCEDRDVLCTMMRNEIKLRVGDDDAAKWIEIPYARGESSMFVVLPKGNGKLSEVEQSLSAETLSRWTGSMRRRLVDLHLPEFSFLSERLNLRETLKALGVELAFDPNQADFSGMVEVGEIADNRNAWLEHVYHRSVVRVDKYGTEAAAATAVTGSFGGGRRVQKPPIPFIANRPFLFFIRDNHTGAILFLGRVVDPTK